jgi:7-cyano-7-deazaguanine synthase
MTDPERKLLLCSGGFDSISLLVLERAQGADITALFFDYGQMNADDERAAARRFCKQFDVELNEAALRDAFPTSGLSREHETTTFLEGKSRFFLPMRNAVFISLAGSWALKLKCSAILVGSVAADETHLDSGPVFFEQMKALVAQCTDGAVRVDFPLAGKRKAEVLTQVSRHHKPAEIMQGTYSCYYPRSSPKVRAFEWGFGCGSCLSCRGRRAALQGGDL